MEVSLKRLPHTEESAAEGVQHVALSVRDDGMGIREEELDKIFDRFYRADASRSTKGNGLGLSMVKKIAELHDAELSVESTEGVGSTFTVVFSKVVAL
ncbi:MAG: sensor histidine kinase [Lachnospiraceae bacterium]|nr:sensor histidine kinase [Lachnospiraceae bacterium]